MAEQRSRSEVYNTVGGINQKVSQYIMGENEVLDISNMNFKYPGSLTKREGTTLALGATVSGKITGVYQFGRLSGASYLIVTANTNAYIATTSFSAFKTGLQNNSLFDFETFVDRLFMTNGNDFFKTDGTNSYLYSLPPGISAPGFGITAAVGGGLSGTVVAGYGYLNERGYRGPASVGITVALNGITFGSLSYYGMSSPSGYGVTAIALYRSDIDQITMYGTTLIPIAATFTDSSPISTDPAPQYVNFTLAPRFLEIFNNQLFLTGVSSTPSTLYWSDIGEPEGIDPTFNAEIRTNDGDVIRGMKVFGSQLVVGKERSTHRLLGDNPNNFTLQEISNQYGMLSNFAVATYDTNMLFLDTKGIVEYDGANISIVSNKMADTFKTMNIDAARDMAYSIHFREQNEIWFAIPCNGATFNNTIVVFDYLSNAWTKYSGVNASVLAMARGGLDKFRPFTGSYSGSLAYFHPDVFSDLNQGFTALIKTRNHAPMGQSSEQQFRRFFANIDPIMGASQAINLRFMTNYSTLTSATFQIYQGPSLSAFQSRIDFGLSAKSWCAEISHYSASLSFKLNGYTIESRFQRSV